MSKLCIFSIYSVDKRPITFPSTTLQKGSLKKKTMQQGEI